LPRTSPSCRPCRCPSARLTLTIPAGCPLVSYPASIDDRGIGTVRYPRTVPNSEEAARELKNRTLTNLYNQRPTWLDLAHQKLDEAVFTAYAWPPSMTDDDLLAALLELNLQRAKQNAHEAV
jgi:hypothetical protein